MIDYDMHIHSTFSDGTLAPEQLFEVAQAAGLKGFAITDHDTVDAMETCMSLAESGKYTLDFIPGIELSTDHMGQEIHVLGYFIDYKNQKLLQTLEGYKTDRYDRMLKMIGAVNALGYDLKPDEVIQLSGGESNSIGRPHIARALIAKGYFTSINQVFDKLLGTGKPGYVERFKISTLDSFHLIKQYGGIPVLAHPGLIKARPAELDKLVSLFVEAGLLGIEVFHSDHTLETSLQLTKLVNKFNLVTTGGSDYHSPNSGRDIQVGSKGITAYDIEKLKMLHASL